MCWKTQNECRMFSRKRNAFDKRHRASTNAFPGTRTNFGIEHRFSGLTFLDFSCSIFTFSSQMKNKIFRIIDYVKSLLWMWFCGFQASIESVRAMLTVLLRTMCGNWNLWGCMRWNKVHGFRIWEHFENLTHRSKDEEKKLIYGERRQIWKNWKLFTEFYFWFFIEFV